ncbi:M48 family metallopeptidase [Colwellia sp. Bg11-12]|jgi:predicted metal-dependent hydrolase|uniref:M48 family metallopeptidase n=1 Tax=Colwellia sp. Bg11-12 TaxID=2759817 RepID=UPI0015F6A386|nr:SprT family zinc-dependent metalloprotease [Colwellia sp. Bg11-12]MBA6264087.1 M48 family metallopeptidase [Colwellia sp. Bg11-12]
MLSYQLIRSVKRKTVGLQVKHGKIIIRAPKYVSEQDIAHIVKSKSIWLQRKIAEQNAQPAAKNDYYQQDSQLLINGERKTLDIHYGLFPDVTFDQDIIIVTLSDKLKTKIAADIKQQDKYVKQQLQAWLKQQTQLYIDQNLCHYAEKIGVLPKSFNVRLYKSRWGSCNSRKELSFSSLLAMTPKWIIDYVIVHELCHLRHMNHSADFWQLVALHYPNYLLAKTWLKSYQSQLQWPTI